MKQNGSPPSRSCSALLVGTDEMLLYTRTEILEMEGFQVSHVEPVHAVERIHNSCPDIIIACHTLSTGEADAVVNAARAISPSPGLIGFTKQLSPLPTSLPFDKTVWSLASPESFVREVHDLLTSRGR